MTDPSWPLSNRGPEALQALLNGDDEKAARQVRMLTPSEMVALSEAAQRLDEMAREHTYRMCGTCNGTLTWDPSGPSRGRPRWRHIIEASCDGRPRSAPTESAA